MDVFPAWLVGLVLVVAFPLALDGGYRLRALTRRNGGGVEPSSGAGYIVSAALTLLGLLIAFTFSLAAERYDLRQRLVIDEANAISTTWWRQQLLAEPERDQLAALMRDYVVEREAAGEAVGRKALEATERRTIGLERQIWDRTGAALQKPAAAPLATPLAQSTNQMFELAATRRGALEAKVPGLVLTSLVLYGAGAAGVMGYALARDFRRHFVAAVGLFALVALAIALIIDLDQPQEGRVQLSNAPLQRVAALMDGGPANEQR